MKLRNAWSHFLTITLHKLIVMKLCFRVGLYRQGLLHDLSKYTPIEFLSGVRYYQGDRSPNAAERMERGYSAAWLHHKGRNPHHYEYWIQVNQKTGEWEGVKMPLRYVLEMVCDRIAASKVYNRDSYTDRIPLDYYLRVNEKKRLHPETRVLLEQLLTMLAEQGEDRTIAYMRQLLTCHRHRSQRFRFRS